MRTIGFFMLLFLLPIKGSLFPETRIPDKPEEWKKIRYKIPSAFTSFPSKKIAFIDTNQLKKSSWYAEAIKNIQESEYEIKPVEKSNEFASPNRQQNIRAYYSADKFTLEPRADDNWKLQLTLKGVYSGKKKIYLPQEDAIAETGKNKIQFNHNNEFTVEYINSKEGVRQNFIIQKEPASKPQTLNIKLQTNNGWLINKVHPKEIHFAKTNGNTLEKKITYHDLKVWDANNRELEATFSLSKKEISININSADAVYPITIDPISTTPSALVESNQATAFMGISVASAGDVNGDGYSDIIVGAYRYDNGETDEGAAFVYHGSATGISTTAVAMVESNQGGAPGAQMGYSVATAGDVNSDGYSDVIVGAPYFDNPQTDEGAAFVYHGSATGINTAAAAIVESNQANAQMGISVATAGDVNGDGYSDVIVGARFYDNVQPDEGAAFIYHGSASGISTTATAMLGSNQANAEMGISVASAGDVNGDGYSDVIVGADAYDNVQTNEGAAFVYHGSASGIVTTVAAMVESNQANAVMGFSVSSAGDVNGDGYSDVIVGAELYDNGQTDEGAAFVYHGSATGINTTAAAMVESNQITAFMGVSVASAGDINGDGYSDVIVGARQYDDGEIDEGAAFIYYGSVSGMNTTTTTILETNQSSAIIASVASAGDVNGDGYSDVIIGSSGFDNGETNEGAAFVYHGSPDGLSATFVNTPDDCNQAFAEFGCSVASAGDVNADGFSDVIIGAYKYDDAGNIDEGRAFVYYGSAIGLSATPNSTPDDANQPGAYFGWSVASAGDINGDGYGDVIIGAYQYDDGGNTDEGRAFIYRGSASGLSLTPDINPPDDADQPTAWFGFSVAGAGDVNGDGYGDVIIGAHNYNDGSNTQEGRAFVYHGSASGLSLTPNSTPDDADQPNALFGVSVASAGDVNGDGYSDVIIGADLYDNGSSDEGGAFIYHGSAIGLSATPNTFLDDANQVSAYFGRSVAAAGDVNGDGYGDVIVGAFAYNDAPNALEGRAYVYHGSPTGLSTLPNSILDDANQPNALFGLCVASAGDVNGDGYSDVIVGAPYYDDASNTDEGRAFIYHGSPTGLSAIPDNIPDDANQADAFFGYYVSSAGDINGDGYSDVIIGAYGFDDPPFTDEGRAFVYYGNNTGGLRNNLRLYNSDLITPIQQSNMSDPNLFGAGLYAKSFIGRQKGKLVWETVRNGNPFTGSPITNSTAFTTQQVSLTNLSLTGTELKNQIAKMNPTKATYIRARVKYDPATAITGQVYGPWRYPEGFLRGRRDVGTVALPVKFISFNAFKQDKSALQKWITTDEEPGVVFEVQHSIDGINFTTLTSINSRNQTQNEYEWLHTTPAKGNNFYRIRAIENQKVAYTATRKLNFNDAAGFIIYPNPAITGQQLIIKNAPVIFGQSITISFINSTGQLIRQKEIVALADGSAALNIPDIPAGAYLLLINAGQWTGHKKIVVLNR